MGEIILLSACPSRFICSSMSRSGKKALSEAIQRFSASQNVQVSAAFCDRLTDHIKEHVVHSLLNEGHFGLNGLGSLNAVERKARTAFNPRTREKVDVPAKKTVTFKVASELKQTLNKD